MSGNRRKNTTTRPVSAEEEALASRVVAIPKNPEQQPGKPAPQAKASQERIGTILRQARLEKNDDLYLIAEYLRIKPAFLIALENSQYDEFPADAYVIGFLRTYASFLGVDGKEAVDRYRYEMAGRRKKPVLAMPVPVSGGRTPSAVIMVGATIAVLLIYAVWYSISSVNRAEVNVQPPLPTVAQPVTPTSLAPAASPASAEGLTAPVTPAPTASAVPALDAIPPASPGIVMQSNAPKMDPHALGAKDDNAAKDVKTSKDTKDDKKQVFGDPDKVSRLIIRATQNSWIMVTDNSGKAIFDHVMNAGDVYKVPNKAGLSLTTGNGNGITLSLDGVDLPKVATGKPHIVRDISLDPDHLTSDSSSTDQ